MSLLRTLKQKGIGIGAVSGILFALLFHALWYAELLDPVEWLALDARFVARSYLPPGDTQAPVTVVAVDERAVAAFGPWPWPRRIQGQIIKEILAQRPKALGINVVYSEPDPRDDPLLAESLQGSIPVVLAAVSHEGQILYPRLELLAPNTFVGHTTVPVDGDGVARRVPYEIDSPFGKLATFGYVLASKSLPGGEAAVQTPLTNDANEIFVNYRSFGSGAVALGSKTETISVVDVIEGSARGKIQDRIVLLGVTASGVKDRDGVLTPLRPIGSMPEVYVHASVVASVLDGSYLKPLSPRATFFYLALVGLIAGACTFAIKPWRGAALAGGLIGVYLLISQWLFHGASLWIPFTPFAFTISGAYLLAVWHHHMLVEGEARRTRAMLERYVSAEVAKALLAEPHLADAHGGRRTLTVLFADIRGFTSFAETESPERVVQTLNKYFELMTEAVFAHGGMVDKFLGDGMMAVFGAPLPAEAHAERAVAAGFRILREVEALRAAGTSLGVGASLGVGIGIHSGEALVGSVGPWRRQEYTAVGDTVNVCARLQELAPPQGMLVSSECIRLLPPDLVSRFEPLDPIKVRGRHKPISVFQPRSQEAVGPGEGRRASAGSAAGSYSART